MAAYHYISMHASVAICSGPNICCIDKQGIYSKDRYAGMQGEASKYYYIWSGMISSAHVRCDKVVVQDAT
jgi:hypothetical protein